MYWQRPDDVDRVLALPEVADKLRPAARAVTAGRALAVGDARCLLAGWDPDATYWLADVLTSGGPPVRWVCDDAVRLGWRPAGS